MNSLVMNSLVMKRKTLIGLSIALVAISATVIYARPRARRWRGEFPGRATATGRRGHWPREPSTEDIKLGLELSGKLKVVRVEEGDTIHEGQVLAELVNDDYRAQELSAQARRGRQTGRAAQDRQRCPFQERREAFSSVREAEAVMNNARAEADRRKDLYAAGVISREETDRYAREYDVAAARLQEAKERHSLVDDRAREEDEAMARADLELAQARLEQARAMYAKTLIKSPISGTVLRKHHRRREASRTPRRCPIPL